MLIRLFSNKLPYVMTWLQVSKWREEKEAMLATQAKQEAALQLEQQAMREREEERRKTRQEKRKVKLRAYHDEKEVRISEEEVWLTKLREESEDLRRESAIRGHTRVRYRREQLVSKLSQQKEILKWKAEEEEQKEQRLEAIRQQVSNV